MHYEVQPRLFNFFPVVCRPLKVLDMGGYSVHTRIVTDVSSLMKKIQNLNYHLSTC